MTSIRKGKAVSRIVKAAAVQISPVLDSRAGAPIEKVVGKDCRAGRSRASGSRPFPRPSFADHPYFSFVQPPVRRWRREYQRLLGEASAHRVPSPETRAIGEAAKHANMVVSIGVNERDGSSIYNTQLLFDADGTPDPAPPQAHANLS